MVFVAGLITIALGVWFWLYSDNQAMSQIGFIATIIGSAISVVSFIYSFSTDDSNDNAHSW